MNPIGHERGDTSPGMTLLQLTVSLFSLQNTWIYYPPIHRHSSAWIAQYEEIHVSGNGTFTGRHFRVDNTVPNRFVGSSSWTFRMRDGLHLQSSHRAPPSCVGKLGGHTLALVCPFVCLCVYSMRMCMCVCIYAYMQRRGGCPAIVFFICACLSLCLC